MNEIEAKEIVQRLRAAADDKLDNIHVRALWLQTKGQNYPRGEDDLETLFAANLLPA
jgi:hypothetical protein